ncbi:MAG TPA: chemotaxis protein CheB, partial [Rhodothermales bacterium]|nr:chemotaxis protein CheB [Rhodothermales bacterium]
GADATFEALQAGAVDFIPKQSPYVSLEINQIRDELVSKILSLTRRRPPSRTATPPKRPEAAGRGPDRQICCPDACAVDIGISTGGPFDLQQVVPSLPATLPVPVLIVQHMPPLFTRSLADRLDALSPLTVCEAKEGLAIRPGMVILAAGGRHLALKRSGSSVIVTTPLDPPGSAHCPSVDVLFQSACDVFGGGVLGVVMTGMGRDGLAGATEIKRRGGTVVVQNEESCVVYGMPKAVAEAGLADAAVPLAELAGVLTRAVTPPDRSATRQSPPRDVRTLHRAG